jgi:hypothetical protein
VNFATRRAPKSSGWLPFSTPAMDPDLEPALGFPEANISVGGGGFYGPSYTSQGSQTRSAGSTDDREADGSDLEPSLWGVTAHGLSLARQDRLGGFPVDDGEQEAGDEPTPWLRHWR